MELIDKCYEALFWVVLVALAVCVVVALVYIFRSKLTVDRIIGINLIGTTVVITIALLTFVLGEPFLADVAMIYVVISFIAVMTLCRIYINLYARRRREKEGEET
ncbi:MAG: MrpF/PhaF family protein [Oscillospiraceae bacterium]|nr:MrpF/PhaF family protein [Oscillospiraceae bacterium]